MSQKARLVHIVDEVPELDRVASAFIRLGVRKLRLTGGEPLVRKGVIDLVAGLSRHLASGALDELTLTTNGMRLAEFSSTLHDYWRRWQEDYSEALPPFKVEPTQRLLRVRLVRIGSGLNGGTLIYLEDLGRAQTEAQQMKLAAMGRLTASIAHEVNQPLAGIVSAIGSEVKSPWTFINPVRYFRLASAGKDSLRVGKDTGMIATMRFAWAMTRVNGKNGLTCGVPISDLAVHWDPERSKQLFTLIAQDRTADVSKALCRASGLRNQ